MKRIKSQIYYFFTDGQYNQGVILNALFDFSGIPFNQSETILISSISQQK